jgi:phosphoribosylformylglycinamidine synthase subunit PurS
LAGFFKKIFKKRGWEKFVPKFIVQVIIENKPYINDPEGDTIHRDLIVKGGYSNIQSVRSAKMLKMVVSSKTQSDAEMSVKKLCQELRIFNPVVSNCAVKAIGKG